MTSCSTEKKKNNNINNNNCVFFFYYYYFFFTELIVNFCVRSSCPGKRVVWRPWNNNLGRWIPLVNSWRRSCRMCMPRCALSHACTKISHQPPHLSVPGRARRLVGIELAIAVDIFSPEAPLCVVGKERTG